MPYANRSSGSFCCVIGCNNSQKKKCEWLKEHCSIDEHNGLQHRDCPCLIPFQLHSFPRNVDTRFKWAAIINRKDFTPSKYSVVCSMHFKDQKPTPENPYPSLHLGYERFREVKPARRKLVRKPVLNCKRPKLSNDINFTITSGIPQPRPDDGIDDTPSDLRDITLESPCDEPKYRETAAQACVTMINVSTQWDPKDVPVQAHIDHSYCKLPCDVVKSSANVGTQCDIQFFTPKLMSDDDVQFYTGLSSVLFWRLLTVLMSLGKSPFKMDLTNQILLVLIRLRLALLIGDLSRRFGISTSIASRVLKYWIPKMAHVLQDAVCWLPRDTIRNTLPECFKFKYPRTTCIIDCTEVFLERGSNHWIRATTYSNYKNHNTFKFLVAVAPNGTIMYISNCYGGRASDQFITRNSGFLSHLLPGDEIMADRGFLIEEDLPPSVRINVPAFTKGREQLPEHEVVRSRRIASVRVHVERVIGQIKKYRILKNCFPLSQASQIDDIVFICSALCNFQKPVVI